ncbi:hypothetical protein [Streptomyces sp. NPDC059272]|uniref:hypothetical protein n=1 Tax=Streptomyces sp. NPDC059272 TaxID=3346800 RepID=UPI0036A8CDC6
MPITISWIQSETRGKDPAPLDATVSYGFQFGDPMCVGPWIFPGRTKPPNIALEDATPRWAHNHGGIDLKQTDLDLTVQGRDTSAVNLLRARVVDLTRTPLQSGAIVEKPGCGGETKGRFLHTSLGDKHPLIVEFDDKSSRLKKNDTLSYFVTNSDTENFNIVAFSDTSDSKTRKPCQCITHWKIALDWAYHDRSGTLIIDDHGKPFETAEGGPPENYVWDPDSGHLTLFHDS